MSKEMVRLAVMACPAHGVFCIAFGDLRVTPSKCCGSWETLRKWRVRADDLVLALAAAKETP
jgi:hypothetical protein